MGIPGAYLDVGAIGGGGDLDLHPELLLETSAP